jgi:hypothetical protein
MLTREDYRQLAERCALLAGECGAPGVAEALRALALNYLARAASAGQEQVPESADGAEPILKARETRGSAISSADQLR